MHSIKKMKLGKLEKHFFTTSNKDNLSIGAKYLKKGKNRQTEKIIGDHTHKYVRTQKTGRQEKVRKSAI